MTKFTVQRTILVLGFLSLAGACGAPPKSAPADAAYLHLAKVAPAASATQFHIEREYAGLVVARQTTSLGFELSGKVSTIYADEGDSVAAGQVLARLDTELLALRARELQAQIQDVVAQQELNELEVRRVVALRAKGFVSEAREDQLNTQAQTLAAQLEQLQAAAEANQTRIKKSSLPAPFSGVVSRRLVDAGTVVDAGQPLVTLLDGGGFEARVGVPVKSLSAVQFGGKVEVVVNSSRLEGVVIGVGSDVTPGSLTVPVRIGLPEEQRFVVGDQAYLQLTQVVLQEGFWLPTAALTDGVRGLWNIYVAVPGEDDGRFLLESRDVEVVHAGTARSYVRGALAQHELVVQGGLHRLTPGQLVRIDPSMVAMR